MTTDDAADRPGAGEVAGKEQLTRAVEEATEQVREAADRDPTVSVAEPGSAPVPATTPGQEPVKQPAAGRGNVEETTAATQPNPPD